MKNKNSFIFKGLISLMLSLVMICGSAVTSLSAVTDNLVAAVKEPVRSAIPDAPAPALSTDQTDISAESEPNVADYGLAEGSMIDEPADDDVLGIDLSDEQESPQGINLSAKKDIDIAATGVAQQVTSLPLQNGDLVGSATSSYVLESSGSGWKIKNGTNYVYNDYGTIKTNGTSSSATSFSVALSNSAFQFSFTNQGTTRYLKYSNGSFSSDWSSTNIPVYRTSASYTVTFNANGGTGTMAEQTISGTANLNENTFTREGYTFTGWNTAADGTGTSYADKASVTLTESITLYAQWQQDAAPAADNTLYFTQPYGWNAPRAYYWKDGVEGTWPGVDMTYVGNNSQNEAIYSISISPDDYDHVIFNAADNSDSSKTYQTVTIDIDDALANGAGIYCINLNPGYSVDSNGHYYVNCYTYGDKSSTGDPNTITYTKQIEKLNPSNTDDYNYRLHLNVDGTALSDIRTVPGEPVKERKIGILLDVTETMLSTWSGSDSGDNKFDGVRQLLQGSDGFLNSILDGHTEVYIIVVGGQQGTASYTDLSDMVASGTTLGDFSNINNSLHVAQGISYVTGLKAAEFYLGNDIDSLVYIIGNETDTYVKYSDGQVERGVTDTNAKNKNYADYLTFMGNHPDLSMYTVYVTPANRGTDIAQQMGEYSVSRGTGGGYYEASDSATLKEKLTQISEEIKIPGDKTTNITVTDTLSKYVDFASNVNLTATLYTDYDATNGTWGSTKSYTESDPELSVVGDKVTFSRANEIEGPFKLEIAFDIKTADGVLQNTDTYGSSGYPNEGDVGTDYSSDTYTYNYSAGQRGYYANSSATISYNLNDTTVNGTFKHPVVQAPENTPVQGKYIFKYIDRYNTERTVEVPVTLNSSEKKGYSGNNNQPGVPTFLWTAEAQELFGGSGKAKNPLVSAALRVDGNDDSELSENPESQKDVSVYKHTIEWNNLNTTTYTEGSNVSFDSNNHTVTVVANTPEMTFTFNYKIMKDGYVIKEGATGIPYGRAVTFHPQYSDASKYAYINDTIPSEGFSYWSADKEGNIPITTNLTFGMLIRGDFTHEEDGETIVTVYAQYNKAPKNDWNPLIEEAKLTHTVEDTEGSQIDWLYLDYMTNYLSKDGSVVKDMIDNGNTNIRYGLIAVKHDGTTTPNQTKMINIAQAMINKNKQSAYLDSAKKTIAYRFEYGSANQDVKPISNFNRVLYTLRSDTEKAENHTFSAIAYITVDGTNYFYSEVNSDIVVHDLIEN